MPSEFLRVKFFLCCLDKNVIMISCFLKSPGEKVQLHCNLDYFFEYSENLWAIKLSRVKIVLKTRKRPTKRFLQAKTSSFNNNVFIRRSSTKVPDCDV